MWLFYSLTMVFAYVYNIYNFKIYITTTRIYLITASYIHIRIIKNSKLLYQTDYLLLTISYILGCLSIKSVPINYTFKNGNFVPLFIASIYVFINLLIDIRYIYKVSFLEIYKNMWEEIIIYVMIIVNIINLFFIITYIIISSSTGYENASIIGMILMNIFLLVKFWVFNFVLWMYTSIGVSLCKFKIAKQSSQLNIQKEEIESKENEIDYQKQEIESKENEIDHQRQELQFQKKIIAIISHECRNPLSILLFIFHLQMGLFIT